MKLIEAVHLRILELCEERHITVGKLCSICGITQSTLCNIIYGRNNSTNVSTIQKICDGLEIDLPKFFDSDLFKEYDM